METTARTTKPAEAVDSVLQWPTTRAPPIVPHRHRLASRARCSSAITVKTLCGQERPKSGGRGAPKQRVARVLCVLASVWLESCAFWPPEPGSARSSRGRRVSGLPGAQAAEEPGSHRAIREPGSQAAKEPGTGSSDSSESFRPNEILSTLELRICDGSAA